MKTKELENRIENVTEKHLCPVCNAELKSPQYACMRYPNHVCPTCSRKATDINGRQLKFFNPHPLGHGCAAKYTDNGEDYNSETCYIDGIECTAKQARFGGIVVETVRNNIINLNDYAEYNKKLSAIMERANNFADEIYESLFDLACEGKWKRWSDSQPIGAIFDVTEDMLRDTGDKNIDMIFEFLDKILEVSAKIHVNQPEDESTEDDDE